MIVRNVEGYIGKCLASAARYFDEVIIVDTGSTDGTKAKVLEIVPNAKVLDYNQWTNPEGFIEDAKETWSDVDMPGPFTGKMMLADFGAARQHGWKEVTSDYAMWIDSDDVLVGGEHIQDVLADMKKDGVDTAMLTYDYEHDKDGNVTCKLTRERILRRGVGSRWVQPIHEVVGPIGIGRFYDKVTLRHRRTEYKLRPEISSRNLKVLMHYFKDKDWDTVDARMLFYLGMETKFTWPDKAIAAYQKYCTRSGWDEERSVAHVYVGQMYETQGKLDLALSEYAQAVVESDFRPEGYFGTARVAYFKKDFRKCAEWTEKGIAVRDKSEREQSVLMHDPLDRHYRPYVYYSAALIELGRHKEALAACEAGLKWNPEDPHLKGNKEVAENALKPKAETPAGGISVTFSRNEDLESPPINLPADVMTSFAIQLWKRSIESRDFDKALAFLDSLSAQHVIASKIEEARKITLKRMQEPLALPTAGVSFDGQKLKIVIWTGLAWEVWSPRSIDDGGIGGSETAAVCMARELVRLGHEVTVVSDCPQEEVIDGVRYVPFRDAKARTSDFPCDVLVVSRQAEAVLVGWQSKVNFLWVHDINVGAPSPLLNESLLRYDKVFCLSGWHKNFFHHSYPQLDGSTVLVTRNGIDTDRFKTDPVKRGNKIIYSSSPDRGLENLLSMLPEIKAEVPDVELNVYYGFTTWKSMADSSGNAEFKKRADDIEWLLKTRQAEGLVNYHGRVGQRVLAKAFLESKVWSYPTMFTETHCITAIEAQAAGCVPVSTYLAALPETVKHGILLQPPNHTEQYRTKFVETVVRLLKDEEERKGFADKARTYAMSKCGWDTVAREWTSTFVEELSKGREVYLPPAGDI